MRPRGRHQIGLIHNRSGPKTMAIEEDEHMASNVKELMDSANAVVPRITPEEARKLIAEKEALVVDVRDPGEVKASGKVKGAINVPRGMIEFRADADTPYHDKAFAKDRPVIVY